MISYDYLRESFLIMSKVVQILKEYVKTTMENLGGQINRIS